MPSNSFSPFQGPLRKWHKLHPCAFATLYASSKAALSAINLQRLRGIGLLPDRKSRGTNRGGRGAGLPQAHALLGPTRAMNTNVCAALEALSPCPGYLLVFPLLASGAQTFVTRDPGFWPYGPVAANRCGPSPCAKFLLKGPNHLGFLPASM